MGQEASAERANFRTHSPEQECEPLSERDLQERVKRLENQIEIFKKLLQVYVHNVFMQTICLCKIFIFFPLI
jgi:hypothetical protein